MSDQTQPSDPQGRREEVDPELVELASQKARGSILRPLIYIGVIALGVWIIGDWTTELQYFFSNSDPVEIGAVTGFADKQSENPNWEPDLPHNRYVSLQGIPSRRSKSRKHRYFKLVGAHVYIEQPLENPEEPLETENSEQPDLSQIDRTYFDGQGRLMSFAQMPDRYRGVKLYYQKQYGTRCCERIDADERRRIRRQQRAAIVDNWKQEYKNASPEERKEKGLTPEPTDEQIQDILKSRPICVDAYLLRAGAAPSDYWWYVALAGIFGIFMLVNLYWLVRWVQRFFGLGEDPESLIEETERT